MLIGTTYYCLVEEPEIAQKKVSCQGGYSAMLWTKGHLAV